MLLEGKKALITGSRRGIGRGIALAFAREGADVGINDVEFDQAAKDTVRMIGELGRKASWHLADASKSSDISRMFDEFLKDHGRIDILVNNAAQARWGPFFDVTEADWDHAMANCLKGYFLSGQRAAREMVRQATGGRIICISSVNAYRQWPGALAYGVAKAGVVRLVQGMAAELAGHNINVNCIAPGYTDSRLLPPDQEHLRGHHADYSIPWIPNRRDGLPADQAGAAVFLASPLGSYVNGTTILVDGGFLSTGVPESFTKT